ncbi:MAG: S8 family serine peptidase, partial [Acidimicrobiia bacterium]|nr:S8 family serine peptidase [Acidimicrobiia bacterium]
MRLGTNFGARQRRVAVAASMLLVVLLTSQSALAMEVSEVSLTTTDATLDPVWVASSDYVEPTAGWDEVAVLPDVDTETFFGSLESVRHQIGMAGVAATGRGVDIALIDTGVVPVDGLDTPHRVVNGPDLSFESQDPDLRYLDTYGHGTHMAGIMVSDASDVPGIAPGSRLVNLKVAAYNGAVDVSQVLAAIDWVVQNRTANGLNIRVLNLSYGTDSLDPADHDLISFATEQAWKAGIVVVAAAGNDGNETRLTSPAYNPYLIAVGAVDGSLLGTNQNPVPEFSNCGAERNPDVVAPGRSISSLRDPGSYADVNYPEARSADGRQFVGSGTSQAAAVVSGAVAVLLEGRPALTPDQVKSVISRSATPLPSAPSACIGAGLLNVGLAQSTWPSWRSRQRHAASTGLGTLEAARGSHHVELDGIPLAGEVDIFGNPFVAPKWVQVSAAGTAWENGYWNGSQLTGSGFTATSWAGPAWQGVSWSGVSWSGVSWSGVSWSGVS